MNHNLHTYLYTGASFWLSVFLILSAILVIGLIFLIYIYRQKISILRNKHKVLLQQYRTLFDDIDIPILLMRPDMVVDANDAAMDLFIAKEKTQIIGQKPIDLISDNYRDFYLKRMQRMKETRSSNITVNYQLKRMDGTTVFASVDTQPYMIEDQLFMFVTLLEKDDPIIYQQKLKKTEQRNRDLLLYMDEGVGVFQRIPHQDDGQLIFSNKKFNEFVGEGQVSHTYQLFSHLFKPYHMIDRDKVFQLDPLQAFKQEIYSSDQASYYQAIFHFNEEDELVVQLKDITKEKKLIQKHQEEKMRIDEILAATDTMIWTWDLTSNEIIFNEETYRTLGYSPNQSDLSDPKKIVKYFHPEDQNLLVKKIYRYFRHKAPYFSVEVRIRDASGHYRWWLIRGRGIRYQDGVAKTISGTYQDITTHKLKDEEIKFLSLHDQLTKVYNLRAYEQKIQDIDKLENLPISLAILDVNGLKVFNDALNHSVGDKLLVETAMTLEQFAKDDDIVARIGGDEFVMIMPKTSIEEAEKRFEALEASLNNKTIHDIPISVSYGIETKYRDRFSLSQIKDLADSKMYQQKFSGKDTRLQILETIRQNFFKQFTFEKEVVEKVHQLSIQLAKRLNMDTDTLSTIDISSQYYNIGIFSIRNDIFNDHRDFEEHDEIEYRKHVENGYRIILATYRNERIALAILHHHEKYNGEGYPGGLAGKSIPLASRIISIAATYARRILLEKDKEEAMDYLKSEKGNSFDPELVDLFVDMIKNKDA